MAKKETRYTFKRRQAGEGVVYDAIKMDVAGNVLDTYKLNERGTQCSCPAHVYCRHQTMLRIFKEEDRVGSGWSYIYETQTWIEPEVIAKKGGLYEDLFGEEEPQPPIHLIDI